MTGAIIINGYFSNEATKNQTSRLSEEFEKLGVKITVLKSNEILTATDNNSKVNIGEFDFVIYLNKDIYQAKLLEKSGYKLFNSSFSISVCDDKMLTNIYLAGNNINMPLTISSPIMYTNNDDENFLSMVKENIKYPIIVKNVFGSMGRNVFIANNDSELHSLFSSLKMYPHIYQQAVGVLGQDTRIITVGKKAVSAMQRKNPSDFRSNVELGGTGTPVLLTESKKMLAEKVSEILDLDYAGIDILTDETGKDYICEVNSNAFFLGTERATGVNIAKLYAEHIIKTIPK
jgi:ribosomal protein S6--L-glutamate ligase/gamma-F420-2:alpha-L-glutamate ligase